MSAKVPGPKKDPKAKGGLRNAIFTERERKIRDAKEAAADFDLVCAARPLRPPPLPAEPERLRRPSELALAEDRRRGLLGRDFVLDAGDE